jgi:hypothetical protein
MRMTAMLGYARVSTIGQDLDAQLAALDAAGVDPSRVFTDKLSGSAKTARPGLVALLDYARPGDSVVVPRSTGSADPSPRSPAPSQISVNGESLCVSHAKASIRPRQQGELSRPSWPASPNWNSNWAASARRIPRIPSRPASAATKPPKLSPERQEQLRRLAVTREPVHQLTEAFGIGRATAYRYHSSSPT